MTKGVYKKTKLKKKLNNNQSCFTLFIFSEFTIKNSFFAKTFLINTPMHSNRHDVKYCTALL